MVGTLSRSGTPRISRISSIALAFAGWLAACGEEVPLEPPPVVTGEPELTEEEQERDARMGTGAVALVGGAEVASWNLKAHEVARDLILQDCLSSLQKLPGGLPFMNGSSPMAGCTYDSMVFGTQNVSAEGVPQFFGPPLASDPNACHITVCRVEAALCVAHRLRELATNVAPMTVKANINLNATGGNVGGSTPAEVVLPPPDAETKVALEEMAFHYAAQAVTVAAENLRKGAGRATTSGVCTAQQVANSYFPGNGQPSWNVGEALAAAFNEGITVADEAARAAVAANEAVAQGDVARFVDRGAAHKAAWSSGSMSRARGAHLLLGGKLHSGLGEYRTDYGMGAATGSTTAATCSIEPPEGDAERAADLLQVSGAHPLLVTNLSVPFATLFTSGGSAGGATDAPLRDRLAERLGDASIKTMSASDFLARQKLSESDFVSARAYGAQQLKFFGRDAKAVLPAMPIASTQNPDGTLMPKTTSHPTYAATARNATPPPAGHYRAMARFVPEYLLGLGSDGINTFLDVSDGLPGNAGAVTPSTTYARDSLIGLLDYARAVSAELAKVAPATPGLSVTAVDLMATYLGAEGAKVTARVESCFRMAVGAPGTPVVPEHRLRVYGAPVAAAADYVLVTGAAGLRCAVDGHVEGAPCKLGEYAPGKSGIGGGTSFAGANVDEAKDAQVGFRTYVETTIQPPPSLTPGQLPYVYIVRKKAGAQAVPGGYELVGGMRLIPSAVATAGYQYCTLQPVQPDVWAEADDTLTPSTENCAMPRKECTEKSWFEKIPLESELSDDGNDLESSWKVYLERARQAADRADQLGEQLVESGLEIDRRIETSVEDLEDYCGEGVSLADYFPGNMAGYRGGSCTQAQENQPCASPAGTVCRSGICVADPLAILATKAATDPAAAKLLRCLSADQLVNVSVGSRPVCAWVGPSGQTCEAFPSGQTTPDCPYLATNNTCPTAVPTGYTALPVIAGDKLLRMFPPPEDAPPPGVEPPMCSKVRQLRDPNVRGEQRKRLTREVSGFFQPATLRPFASRVGWEARPDDYSAITVDGIPKWQTGSIFNSAPATSWPCVTAASDKGYPAREGKAAVACPATPAGGNELNASFFCASTLECAPTSDAVKRGRRARLNHRMGRAVFALRVLTGAGIGSSLRAPYLPTQGYVEHDADSWDGGDWEYSRRWPQSNVSVTLPDGRSAAQAPAIEYRAVEYDQWPNGDDVGSVVIDGLGFCFNTGANVLWTHFPGALAAAGNGMPYTGGCASSAWHASFKTYPSSQGSESGSVVGRIWAGLDGSGTIQLSVPMHSLVLRTIMAPDLPGDTMMLEPFGPGVGELTNLWLDESWVDEDLLSDDDRYAQNTISVVGDGLRARDVLDAMELACEVARLDLARADVCGAEPPTPDSLQDLGVVADYMDCQANKIRQRAEREILVNVPQVALDALKPGYRLEGERGAVAGRFAGALTSLRDQQLALTSAMRSFARDVQSLNIQLRKHGISRELIEINKLSSIANQMSACASSAASPGEWWGAAAVCMNAAFQISLALESASLQFEGVELDEGLTWLDFQARLDANLDLMQRAANDLEATGAELRAALADLETLRQKGLRNLAKALMLGTDAAGRHFNVNTVMRRRYNTLLVRYQRAWDDAKKMAWLAKRAVEQRLGLKLTDLGDMALVEAPSSWAESLCELGGIDYTRIRQENGLDGDDYADEYLGDYVRKLELVVASYEHDFPFHEGEDTAVVSLRDDVTGVRDYCTISVPNLLAYSALLDVAVHPADSQAVAYESATEAVSPTPPELRPQEIWTAVNCKEDAEGVSLPDCVRVTRLDGSQSNNQPYFDAPNALGDVPAYQITFGPATAQGWNPWSTAAPTVFGQKVTLPRGWYRLSYLTRSSPGASGIAGNLTLRSLADVKVEVPRNGPMQEAINPLWSRIHQMHYVDTPGEYIVGLGPQFGAAATAPFYIVAAVMLEDISGQVLGGGSPLNINPAEFEPIEFIATEEAGEAVDAVCEDTDGSVFRTLWRRGCAELCADGFGSCPGKPVACYWELEVPIALEDTESGSFLGNAGFAHGNYNYRLDSLALNFVGTGLKDCSSSTTPSSCQANASVPFSLEHIGPYPVRNHQGGDYEAPLFVGRIEHGRGLAAERYLTNPISSGDRSLIEPYTHHELRGRPLTGTYKLRVWDVDGLELERLEDVQLVLGYRYWTRFGD